MGVWRRSSIGSGEGKLREEEWSVEMLKEELAKDRGNGLRK